KAKEHRVAFIEPHGDSLILFDSAQKPFNKMSFTIGFHIIAIRGFKVRSLKRVDPFWRDNGLRAMGLE
ncbi:MAG: hypothetical protein ACRC4G_05710, partial [Alphaproteobacteria bacterium]